MSYNLNKHLQYNVWANGKIVEILSNADEKLFDADVKSSFLSIKKTILHVLDAESVWMKRLMGESPTTWPSAGFAGGKNELLATFVNHSKNLAEFIEMMGESFLQSEIAYKSMKGDAYTNTVEEILFHVINHGTFHRGQLITMLRELGLTQFPSTDLITFLRQ